MHMIKWHLCYLPTLFTQWRSSAS